MPRNVIVLGWVSFFTDLASEMLYPVIPLFLVGTLGAAPALLGFIDGLAEGISSGLRWIGGALSDRYRKRKPFVALGYGISALSKPIMGCAAIVLGWPLFLVGRCSDRLGKSIRTAARDALIADSTPKEMRGAAFGLHRAMDTCGAIIGPLVALVILGLVAGWSATFHAGLKGQGTPLSRLPLTWLFFAAVIPGLFSVVIVLTGAREILPKEAPGAKVPSIWQKFPARFWHLLIANFVFSLGNSSDTFLILRSNEVGLGFGYVILVYAVYNVVYAAGSRPLGALSDRVGRKPVVIAGWLIYAGVYLGFSLMHAPLWPWVLLGIYGAYQAMTDGVTKALVSDVVPLEQRAGAIGMFYTASGVGQLIASIVAGVVWNYRLFQGSLMLAFVIGTICALVAIPILATVRLSKEVT